MAEETKIKVAMGDAFGATLIGFAAFMIAFFLLEVYTSTEMMMGVSSAAGIGLALATVIVYLNENILGTMIFGPLAVFFYVLPQIALVDPLATGMLIMFVGVYLLLVALVSMMQPIKFVPLLLVVAFLALFIIGYWWYGGMASDTLKLAGGIFGVLLGILATYLGLAVTVFGMTGEPKLPLLIK